MPRPAAAGARPGPLTTRREVDEEEDKATRHMLVDPHALARALGAPPPCFLARDSWYIHAPRFSAAAPAGSAAFEALWAAHPDEFLLFRAPGGGGLVPYPRWAAAYGVSYAFSQQVARAAPVGAAPALVGAELRRWDELLRPLRGGGDGDASGGDGDASGGDGGDGGASGGDASGGGGGGGGAPLSAHAGSAPPPPRSGRSTDSHRRSSAPTSAGAASIGVARATCCENA